MHRFRILIISATLTLSLFAVGLFALSANAVVPQGDTGNWMVSIDSIVPTDSSAQIHGTLYDGISPAGANISITTRHITSASATQVQNGSQTHGVTDSAGKFAITIDTLIPATSYNVNATATAPQGTLATSTQETFTTNQSNTDNSVQIAYNNPQPPTTAHGMVLKFKASGVTSPTTATIQLKLNSVVVKTNTAQITPDGTANALFQTPFTGLSPSTTYDVEVMVGDGAFISLSPKSTATATGGQPPANPIQASINDVTITSTTATIEGVVIGDGQTLVTIKGVASADGTTYGINSSTGYTGAPDALWGAGFTSVFTGLTPSASYAYKITDTISGNALSSIHYFTTAPSSGGVGSTGIDGTWFDLNANYQSAITQTNKCREDKEGEYCMLAPIPFPGIINGKLGLTPDTTGSSGVSNFINGIIQFAIAFAGLLAVIMIIAGGIMYATTEAMSGKAGAKTMIINAIFGLLLALCSYLILKTINPALVDVKLDIARHEVTVEGDTNTPVGNIGTLYSAPNVYCPKTGGGNSDAGSLVIAQVAQSFIGKTTYTFGGKGSQYPNSSTIALDCSGYVNRVYQCAGLPPVPPPYGGGTVAIFNGATKITNITGTKVNGVELKTGDLLGWPEQGSQKGHVIMYLGLGKIIHSHGPKDQVGQAVTSSDLSSYPYLDKIKSDGYIKRL